MAPHNLARIHTPRTAATVLGEIRAHDIGDVCDQLWANAFGTVALAVPAEPEVSALTGFDQLSQEHKERGGQSNKRAPSQS